MKKRKPKEKNSLDKKIYLAGSDERILSKLASGKTLERRAFHIFTFLILKKNFKKFVHKIRKIEK